MRESTYLGFGAELQLHRNQSTYLKAIGIRTHISPGQTRILTGPSEPITRIMETQIRWVGKISQGKPHYVKMQNPSVQLS